MRKIRVFIASFVLVAMATFVFMPVSQVGAENALDVACANNSTSELCQSQNKDKNAGSLVGTIINTLLFIVGALAVVMIIVGGIFYVISQGDSGSVAKAKNTILYSVVGFFVALIAYALVNWVFHLFR